MLTKALAALLHYILLTLLIFSYYVDFKYVGIDLFLLSIPLQFVELFKK